MTWGSIIIVLLQFKKVFVKQKSTGQVGAVVKDIATGTEGLGFDSQAGQIIHCYHHCYVPLELCCTDTKSQRWVLPLLAMPQIKWSFFSIFVITKAVDEIVYNLVDLSYFHQMLIKILIQTKILCLKQCFMLYVFNDKCLEDRHQFPLSKHCCTSLLVCFFTWRWCHAGMTLWAVTWNIVLGVLESSQKGKIGDRVRDLKLMYSKVGVFQKQFQKKKTDFP